MNSKRLRIISIAIILFEIINLFFENSILSCHLEGCLLSGNLLSFNKDILRALAIVFFVLIYFIDLIKLKTILRFFLFAGFILETTLLSYLIKMYESFCIECFTIWLSLFVLNFLYNRKLILFALFIPLAFSFLSPIKKIDFDNNKKNKILFTKESCSHCKAVKKYLNEKNILIKEEPYESNKHLFNILGMNSVPVLLVKDHGKIEIFQGEQLIKEYFEKATENSFIPDYSFNYKNINNEENGCSIEETKKCEE